MNTIEMLVVATMQSATVNQPLISPLPIAQTAALGAGVSVQNLAGVQAAIERSADGVIHWQPTEDLFFQLATTDPATLIAWIDSKILVPTDLTFAAEALGKGAAGPDVYRVLIGLLAHSKLYVREGALYGLARHLGVSSVRDAVQNLAACDPVADLRGLADEILQD